MTEEEEQEEKDTDEEIDVVIDSERFEENTDDENEDKNSGGVTRRDLLAAAGGGAVAVGAGYLGTSFFGSGSKNTDDISLESAGRITTGSNNAPVAFYYWTDYQCPYCHQFERQVLPQLEQEYMVTGEVYLIVKLLGIFGDDSQRAANATYAVYENYSQDIFWNWRSYLAQQAIQADEKNNGWATVENLRQGISENFPQINPELVVQAVENESYNRRLQTDLSEGQEMGLEGTPFHVLTNTVNVQKTSGAQSFSHFQSLLSPLLEGT